MNENQQGPGRPPIAGETATAHIHLRTTMERKSAYVKAAKPGKLTEWAFGVLDKAADYDPRKPKSLKRAKGEK